MQESVEKLRNRLGEWPTVGRLFETLLGYDDNDIPLMAAFYLLITHHPELARVVGRELVRVWFESEEAEEQALNDLGLIAGALEAYWQVA